MLIDFFKLNRPFKVFNDELQLTTYLADSDDLENVLFKPDTLTIPSDARMANRIFTKKTFTNVSFSKTKISGIVFRDCKFVACLFIGTRFVDCEFHNCTFIGCNPHKVKFKNTYIHPSVFVGMLDPSEHSNIGIHLFQQLYINSTNMFQYEFADSADFNRRKWIRYALNYKFPRWDKIKPQYIGRWLGNYFYYVFAGYGVRASYVAVWALIVTCVSIAVNFLCWDSFGVMGKDGPVLEREFVTILYYTVTIPVGVGDFTPTSSVGRVIFLAEALLGLTILSLFATWLVKRALR